MPLTIKAIEGPSGLALIEPRRFDDDRGWFMETYKASELHAAGLPTDFVQDNHSHSAARGTLRGLHYQLARAAQGKLVRCSRGQVFDVAVDIRKGSPTYGSWFGLELTAQNARTLWVPPGFAHGFQALTDEAEVQYKVTAEYDRDAERCVRWDDPTIGVEWPVRPPGLSDRDAAAPTLATAENDLTWEDHRP